MGSATYSRGSDPCQSLAPILGLGAALEPLAHPKPGAVTRLYGQADKDILDFAVHSAAINSALLASCSASASGSPDPIAEGLRAYRLTLWALNIAKNVGLGQALMLIPLAAALPRAAPAPSEVAREATRIAMLSTQAASAEYYALLRMLGPSHLGRYRGPLPDVSEGEPGVGLGELLRSVRWDLVASEVTGNYPLTLRAVEALSEETGAWDAKVARALALVLSAAGDTLIARKWGLRAYLASRAEVLVHSRLRGPLGAMEALDGAWRPRGWSPGSSLDVVAAAVGLYLLSTARL